MTVRMPNPFYLLSEAGAIPVALEKAVSETGVPLATLAITAMRASQINGGAACLWAEVNLARKEGITDDQLATVAAWRSSPYFSDAECAALALAEAVTEMAHSGGDIVSDELWQTLSRHYDERQRAALILWLAGGTMFNIVNNVVREEAGQSWDNGVL
ncbi:AhpD family alkylhydroperoxidase [Nocardia tenerifensis]|uniref:AhpD family alkylhydroperoxidase n=1 Tax=Nocardia tenerifensis TaxID=228006 RepID=A0A318JUA6_9NOCA|nr:carboxymuconolactone decarboxylase family protein [Nocardia tenerifensis]PXX56529.1 AhpD family alkylhydroperoxidase [Nocardia tenerifensis]